jgi:preprotein translocase subunit SecG
MYPSGRSNARVRIATERCLIVPVLESLLLVVQLVSALGIIVLVLLQQGKGADMGAAFGAGSAGSVFGSSGSANFLSRTTAILAVLFFVCTLGLSYLASASLRQPVAGGAIMESIPGAVSVPPAVDPSVPSAPSAPAAGGTNQEQPAKQ